MIQRSQTPKKPLNYDDDPAFSSGYHLCRDSECIWLLEGIKSKKLKLIHIQLYFALHEVSKASSCLRAKYDLLDLAILNLKKRHKNRISIITKSTQELVQFFEYSSPADFMYETRDYQQNIAIYYNILLKAQNIVLHLPHTTSRNRNKFLPPSGKEIRIPRYQAKYIASACTLAEACVIIGLILRYMRNEQFSRVKHSHIEKLTGLSHSTVNSAFKSLSRKQFIKKNNSRSNSWSEWHSGAKYYLMPSVEPSIKNSKIEQAMSKTRLLSVESSTSRCKNSNFELSKFEHANNLELSTRNNKLKTELEVSETNIQNLINFDLNHLTHEDILDNTRFAKLFRAANLNSKWPFGLKDWQPFVELRSDVMKLFENRSIEKKDIADHFIRLAMSYKPVQLPLEELCPQVPSDGRGAESLAESNETTAP